MENQKIIQKRMKEEGLPEVVISNFLRLYDMIVSGKTGEILENDIQPVNGLASYDDIQNDTYLPVGKQNRGKLAVLKLNGGLGTGMGLDNAKSLLEVKKNITF